VDLRAGVDVVKKRKFLTLLGLKLRSLSPQPVVSRYTDYANLSPKILLQCRPLSILISHP
jgi:hypothetical protein